MIQRRYLLLPFLVLGLVLVAGACQSDTTPVPDNDDAPILSGTGDLPKSLATIWISPTSESPLVSTTPIPLSPTNTNTPEPPEPTRTPTAAVGVFVGGEEEGTPQVDVIPPIAVPPFGGSTGGVTGSIPVQGGVPANCGVPVAEPFQRVYTENPAAAAQLGCPRGPAFDLTLVGQKFERGDMFWRETRDIFVLPSTGQYVIVSDNFQDGMPETDAAYDNPPDGLKQPIRGFGLIWRNNEDIRNSLGWAIESELPYAATWQDFDNGSMFLADLNRVFILLPNSLNSGQVLGPFQR
jgi:hypothetical protein